jgi:hypothetical protein
MAWRTNNVTRRQRLSPRVLVEQRGGRYADQTQVVWNTHHRISVVRKARLNFTRLFDRNRLSDPLHNPMGPLRTFPTVAKGSITAAYRVDVPMDWSVARLYRLKFD